MRKGFSLTKTLLILGITSLLLSFITPKGLSHAKQLINPKETKGIHRTEGARTMFKAITDIEGIELNNNEFEILYATYKQNTYLSNWDKEAKQLTKDLLANKEYSPKIPDDIRRFLSSTVGTGSSTYAKGFNTGVPNQSGSTMIPPVNISNPNNNINNIPNGNIGISNPNINSINGTGNITIEIVIPNTNGNTPNININGNIPNISTNGNIEIPNISTNENIEIPNISTSNIAIPKINTSNIEIPKINTSNIEIPKINTSNIANSQLNTSEKRVITNGTTLKQNLMNTPSENTIAQNLPKNNIQMSQNEEIAEPKNESYGGLINLPSFGTMDNEEPNAEPEYVPEIKKSDIKVKYTHIDDDTVEFQFFNKGNQASVASLYFPNTNIKMRDYKVDSIDETDTHYKITARYTADYIRDGEIIDTDTNETIETEWIAKE